MLNKAIYARLFGKTISRHNERLTNQRDRKAVLSDVIDFFTDRTVKCYALSQIPKNGAQFISQLLEVKGSISFSSDVSSAILTPTFDRTQTDTYFEPVKKHAVSNRINPIEGNFDS